MYYGMGYGMFMDPTYVLVLIAALIALAASGYCTSTMKRYRSGGRTSGITKEYAAKGQR